MLTKASNDRIFMDVLNPTEKVIFTSNVSVEGLRLPNQIHFRMQFLELMASVGFQ